MRSAPSPFRLSRETDTSGCVLLLVSKTKPEFRSFSKEYEKEETLIVKHKIEKYFLMGEGKEKY